MPSFKRAIATHAKLSSSWEEFAVLVEADGHDAVGRPERLLDAVAVVAVDVDVQDARDRAEHFKDAKDDVVDIAEAGCLTLLRVVQSTRPVDRDVGLARSQATRPRCIVSGRADSMTD